MKSALFVWGGWDGHEPKQAVEAVAPVIEKDGFKVEVSNMLDAYLDADKMKSYSVIVQCWTMGEIAGEQWNGLSNAVKGGVGVAGWHGGLGDSFRTNSAYQFMVGGQFVDHPGGIIDYDVHITKPDDPIVKGIGNFKHKSEQYYMHVDPSNEVLAETPVTGQHCPWVKPFTMPVVWKRMYGKGRVFYSALGHVAKEFEVPQIMEITRRGILWAAGN